MLRVSHHSQPRMCAQPRAVSSGPGSAPSQAVVGLGPCSDSAGCLPACPACGVQLVRPHLQEGPPHPLAVLWVQPPTCCPAETTAPPPGTTSPLRRCWICRRLVVSALSLPSNTETYRGFCLLSCSVQATQTSGTHGVTRERLGNRETCHVVTSPLSFSATGSPSRSSGE